jgi:hypothetical protein
MTWDMVLEKCVACISGKWLCQASGAASSQGHQYGKSRPQKSSMLSHTKFMPMQGIQTHVLLIKVILAKD